jgi:hypothetical protein
MICITISCRMDTSNQGASFIGSAYSSTSSTTQRICFCERPTVVKTAHTERNFGRRFVSCENWKASITICLLLFCFVCCNVFCLGLFEFRLVIVCTHVFYRLTKTAVTLNGLI